MLRLGENVVGELAFMRLIFEEDSDLHYKFANYYSAKDSN